MYKKQYLPYRSYIRYLKGGENIPWHCNSEQKLLRNHIANESMLMILFSPRYSHCDLDTHRKEPFFSFFQHINLYAQHPLLRL